MKKLIIIYGLHLDKVQNHATEECLMKILKEQSFLVSKDLPDLNIIVYKNADLADHSKLTHIVINFGNEIAEIKYYTTKP